VASKHSKRKSDLKILVVERDDMHCLMVQSLGGLNPAGWRLQRGEPMPVDEFEFLDLNDAIEARNKLQEYVNG
jgi:hypothetical protein